MRNEVFIIWWKHSSYPTAAGHHKGEDFLSHGKDKKHFPQEWTRKSFTKHFYKNIAGYPTGRISLDLDHTQDSDRKDFSDDSWLAPSLSPVPALEVLVTLLTRARIWILALCPCNPFLIAL